MSTTTAITRDTITEITRIQTCPRGLLVYGIYYIFAQKPYIVRQRHHKAKYINTMKHSLRKLAYVSGLLPFYHGIRNQRALTVVLFHRVLPEDAPEWQAADPEWTVTTSFFESCLKFFRSHYNGVSFSQVMANHLDGEALPPNPLLITFDDGWNCNLRHAAPLLRKYHLPALLFVTTGAVGKHILSWQEALFALWKTRTLDEEHLQSLSKKAGIKLPASLESEQDFEQLLTLLQELPVARRRPLDDLLMDWSMDLPGLPYMLNENELMEIQDHGISLGTHGVSHDALVQTDSPHDELHLSWKDLCRITGNSTPVQCFSPPQGRYNKNILKIAESLGYVCACTSKTALNALNGRNTGILDLGRINIEQPALSDQNGKLDPSRLASLLFRQPILAA
ncbi:polysaccharide deacetylase family protein [Thiolapillus sp.]